MTTTPTVWNGTSYIGFGSETGIQAKPQAIGLSDGRILTVWEDDTDGTSTGYDIVGRFRTADGILAGPVFQINYAFFAGNETEPKIIAMPDGDS